MRDESEYRFVVDSYRKLGIPLDAQWADIDYMDNYRIFTIDQTNFKNLSSYVDDIGKNMNIRFVPIVDAGVAMRPGGDYSVYNSGVE
jgi:alpha-glucosidase